MRNFVALAAFALLALFCVSAAYAATEYPSTLVEQTCTDTESTASTGYAQSGGSTDKKCDHDRRILTGAIVADTTFGPFPGGRCVYIFADGNTVTGGDTKWHFTINAKQPHNAEIQWVDISDVYTGAADSVLLVGVGTDSDTDGAYELDIPLPNLWYLILDLNTADSWTGEISLVGC